MSQVTATTSLAYRFYESLALFATTVGILQGDKYSRLYVELTARRKAWSSSRSGGFAFTARSCNKKSAWTDTFFIGHCVLQNGRRHRTLSSRRHPLYRPQSHINAELVERYTSESAVSVALQQFSYVRVSLYLFTLCNLLETSFIKIGTIEMAGPSIFTWWHSSWIFLGGVRRLFFLT